MLCRNTPDLHEFNETRNMIMEITAQARNHRAKALPTISTGTVRIDPLFNPHDAERVQGAQ